MPSSIQIREQRGELHDKATAINALADSEERDLTPEEKAEFDQVMEDYEVLGQDLKRAEWREAEEERLAASRANTADPEPNKIVVPARAKSAGPLKAFDDEAEAYMSGQWLLANLWGHDGAKAWCDQHIRAAQSTTDNLKGGNLVPEEFERSIIRLVEEYGVFRRNARVIPMASDTYIVPRRLTGITVYFPGENTEITASDPTHDQVTLTARKMAALVKYSSEIDQDAVVSIADMLATEIAYGFAVKEDACGFLGTGTSTYGGISGLITQCAAATATVVTAATANTAFSTLDLTDFESMVGKLPRFPGIRPKWYISQAGWAASMMRLQDAAGGNTSANLGAGPGLSFLGYPVEIVQSMNSTLTAQTSTNGLCYFGDLAMAATFGQRRGVQIALSNDRYFEYDQIGIKGTERFDINIHDVGDTSNPGAMIMLSTPAS